MRTLLLSLTLVLAACGPRTPLLEREGEADWIEVTTLELISLVGERRGAEVTATALLSGGGGDGTAIEIELDIELVLDPPARFVGGRHRARISDRDSSGPLSSESVTFLGGQNTAGSVGGVFLFSSQNEGTRYRVRFPATIME